MLSTYVLACAAAPLLPDWLSDLYQVNPHFGGGAQLLALVRQAHSRGMLVMLDVVVNHAGECVARGLCVCVRLGLRHCHLRLSVALTTALLRVGLC